MAPEAEDNEGQSDRGPATWLSDEFGEYHLLQVVAEDSRVTEDECLKWSVERFYFKVYYLARKRQVEHYMIEEQNRKAKRHG